MEKKITVAITRRESSAMFFLLNFLKKRNFFGALEEAMKTGLITQENLDFALATLKITQAYVDGHTRKFETLAKEEGAQLHAEGEFFVSSSIQKEVFKEGAEFLIEFSFMVSNMREQLADKPGTDFEVKEFMEHWAFFSNFTERLKVALHE